MKALFLASLRAFQSTVSLLRDAKKKSFPAARSSIGVAGYPTTRLATMRVRLFKELELTSVARKFLIKGEVQGVGYRFFAQRAAAKHQVVGYVRNCPDGTVEALAEGPADSVEEFKYELAAGPQWSTVDHIEEIHIEPTGTYTAFRIER